MNSEQRSNPIYPPFTFHPSFPYLHYSFFISAAHPPSAQQHLLEQGSLPHARGRGQRRQRSRDGRNDDTRYHLPKRLLLHRIVLLKSFRLTKWQPKNPSDCPLILRLPTCARQRNERRIGLVRLLVVAVAKRHALLTLQASAALPIGLKGRGA